LCVSLSRLISLSFLRHLRSHYHHHQFQTCLNDISRCLQNCDDSGDHRFDRFLFSATAGWTLPLTMIRSFSWIDQPSRCITFAVFSRTPSRSPEECIGLNSGRSSTGFMRNHTDFPDSSGAEPFFTTLKASRGGEDEGM